MREKFIVPCACPCLGGCGSDYTWLDRKSMVRLISLHANVLGTIPKFTCGGGLKHDSRVLEHPPEEMWMQLCSDMEVSRCCRQSCKEIPLVPAVTGPFHSLGCTVDVEVGRHHKNKNIRGNLKRLLLLFSVLKMKELHPDTFRSCLVHVEVCWPLG